MVPKTDLRDFEIASRVGASREMVSRILKDPSVGGYLTQSRTGLVLHRNPPRTGNFAPGG